MLTGGGRLLAARVSVYPAFVKDFNPSTRGTSVKSLSAIAAPPPPQTPPPPVADAPSAATSKSATRPVSSFCCGFSKDLINAPSMVGENGKFGEDACFVTRYKSTYVAGVADGVGGWKRYRIDPSRFSTELMQHCADIVRGGDFTPSRPDKLMAQAYERLSVSPRPIGSSTACLVVVHERQLYAANLGDSGFLVYRSGKIIRRSAEQVHYFNAPFQLTILPEQMEQEGFIFDTPEKSELHIVDIESGDIVLLATDGLWDNVPEATIVEALNGAKPSNLRAKCNTIALIARRLSTDVHHASPFAQKASEHGYSAHGGKPDDITLVILHIS